jgi:creatinine amidohydrolase
MPEDTMRALLLAVGLISIGAMVPGQQRGEPVRGIRLEQYSWVEAAKALTAETVVVIPLGASLKEHGPHLKLRNDLTMAEYLADRVAGAAPVVVTPPLTYHFYPAFLDYPGSTSLSLETARDATIQVVRSLAQHGPMRFYILNTGISTLRAIEPAAATLAQDGVLVRYTNLGEAVERVSARIRQQEGGSHADEIETSMMLYIDPSAVDMKLAVKDFAPASTPMRLRRTPGAGGVYSPTGTWGDPTLATREKGATIVEGLVSTILQEIDALRNAPLPAPPGAAASGAATRRSGAGAVSNSDVRGPNGCTSGEERTIRRIEASFNVAWTNKDAEALAALWALEGDIVHTDGVTTERGRQVIQRNRAEQFRRPEFRGSRHILSFGSLRCLSGSVAVVDLKWELRNVLDSTGNTLPNAEGLSTMVVQRTGESWLIEAYRYNVKPGAPAPPRFVTRPGYPDKR